MLRNKFDGTGAGGYHPGRKLVHAWTGLRFALRHDVSVSYKLVLSAVVLASSFRYRQWMDFALIAVVTGQVLMAELFNTAIEAIGDVVSPGHDERVGRVKDVAAAAAGVSIVVWGGVLAYEYYGLLLRVAGPASR